MRASRLSLVVVIVSVACAACGSGDQPKDETDAPRTTGATVGSDGTGNVAGRLGSEPFVFRSGAGNVDKDGKIELLLSDSVGLCTALGANELPAGTTLFQAYDVPNPSASTATGQAVLEVKYAKLEDDCAKGQAIASSISSRGRAVDSKISVTQVTGGTITGTLDVTFDDGSRIAGAFSVPACAAPDLEHARCR